VKKLNIFLLKSYIGPFVLTFFVSLFVLLMQFLWKYVDDFVGKGFEWYVIAELMFFASATFVPMALPLAVLLSSLMTFGNLGENYELVAIKASGISLQKVMKPLIIFIIFVSIGALYFSNNILPKANLKFLTLLRDVRHKKPAVQIKEGVFYNEISDYVIKVGKKDQDGITIHDIVIYNHLKGKGNTNLTIAKDGRMEMTADKRYLVFTLFDGVNYDEDVPINKKTNYTWRKQWNTALQTTYFKKEIQRFDLSAFAFKKSNSDLYRNNYQMLNLKQLQFFEDSLSRARDSVIRKYQEYNVNDLNFLTLYDREQAKDTTHNIVDSLLNKQKPVAHKTSKEKDEGTIPDLERVNPLFTAKKKDSAKLAATVIDTNMLDTNLAFQADILSNFPKDMQRKIVSSALQSIRNASYHSSIIVTNIEGRDTYIVKHKIEWHKKFTLSFACIILFFIGAPLGAIIRKGGLGMPLVISVVMFVLYHILSIVGEKSVKEFVMEPWFGMWLASMAFLPLGIFFTIKATSDAPLMETEAWQKFFTKLLHPFKKNKQKK
jgi:lipopolysaccharide export system permease protein